MSGKTKLTPEEMQHFEEKQLYACKVWGLQTKIGELNSYGIREE